MVQTHQIPDWEDDGELRDRRLRRQRSYETTSPSSLRCNKRGASISSSMSTFTNDPSDSDNEPANIPETTTSPQPTDGQQKPVKSSYHENIAGGETVTFVLEPGAGG